MVEVVGDWFVDALPHAWTNATPMHGVDFSVGDHRRLPAFRATNLLLSTIALRQRAMLILREYVQLGCAVFMTTGRRLPTEVLYSIMPRSVEVRYRGWKREARRTERMRSLKRIVLYTESLTAHVVCVRWKKHPD